jgi:hypothetical protein
MKQVTTYMGIDAHKKDLLIVESLNPRQDFKDCYDSLNVTRIRGAGIMYLIQGSNDSTIQRFEDK